MPRTHEPTRARRAAPASLALLVLLAGAFPAAAHMGPAPGAPDPEPPKPKITVEKIAEGAWCLYGYGGNIGVVATPGAILMVDTQFADLAPAIEAEIRKLSPSPIRYVVDTHYHFDHVGGNAHFGREAALVGHENVRIRLFEGPPRALATMPEKIRKAEGILGSERTLDPVYRSMLEGRVRIQKVFLEEAKKFKAEEVVAPALTYDTSMSLWLGDEEVRIFHAGPGHTDGDSIVYFPKRKTVHMGDLFVTGSFPFVDVEGGGATEGWLKNLDATLASLPGDARVIPGHGKAAGVTELKRFRSYIADLRAAVAGAIAAGRSLEEAVASIKLEAYSDLKPGFQSLSSNIDQVWQEMKGDR